MASVPVHSIPVITVGVYPETGPVIMTMTAMTTVMKRTVITMVSLFDKNENILKVFFKIMLSVKHKIVQFYDS